MTDQEYQIEYRHALQELRKQGYDIVELKGTQSLRRVLVDGFPCSDWEVFCKTYDEHVAEIIAKERSHPIPGRL